MNKKYKEDALIKDNLKTFISNIECPKCKKNKEFKLCLNSEYPDPDTTWMMELECDFCGYTINLGDEL